MSLHDHLATGSTTICRCWRVSRTDGVRIGFTDHDGALSFDGTSFRADSGLSARALMQNTGLSVDNSDALGVLSTEGITEADIEQGRYDDALVEAWLVNWADPDQRLLRFAGTIGGITRHGDAFEAELRGRAEALNEPRGRVYQPQCQAVLGDAACRVRLATLAVRRRADAVAAAQSFTFHGFDDHPDRWFERGQIRMEEGAGAGLSGIVKSDRLGPDGTRTVTLWEPIRAEIGAGQAVTLTPGCDKRLATCREKFGNVHNFRGFPTIPGEDWLLNPAREVAG